MRELALNLARAETNTSVAYWYELPLIELFSWMDTVIKVEKARPKPKQGK